MELSHLDEVKSIILGEGDDEKRARAGRHCASRAEKNGHLLIIQWLVETLGDQVLLRRGRNPLHRAVRGGWITTAEWIVGRNVIPIDSLNAKNLTVLDSVVSGAHGDVSQNEMRMIKMLVVKGGAVLTSVFVDILMESVVSQQDLEWMMEVIGTGWVIGFTFRNLIGRGDLGLLKWFTDRYGPAEGKGQAFNILSLAYEHFTIAWWLVEKKIVDVEERDPETKNTPLLTACLDAGIFRSKKDFQRIQYLVEVCGANVDAVNRMGQTVWDLLLPLLE
jgi:hypothetical protein